jgi:hypothetical protein
LWSTWNTKSSRRGVGGTTFYIRKKNSPHISLHKKDSLNQFIWVEISDINANMYITIFYCAPINSTFYTKNNLDKNCPYKISKQDIYNLGNEGSILLLEEFNAQNTTNQAIILSNNSNHNSLWLEEDLILANI